MLKTAVDSDVMAETFKFMNNVFAKHGTQVTATIDYFSMTYLEKCQIIKKYSQEQNWASANSQKGVQLADISFSQVADIAIKKNDKIAEYLGNNFRSNVNRPARRLRQMFRDRGLL